MYKLDTLTMRRTRSPILSVFSKERMPPSGRPSTVNNVPCPLLPEGALNARDQSVEAPGKPSASNSSISRRRCWSRMGTNCMPALLCVREPPALVCVHGPAEAARPVIEGFGGLVGPDGDARQAVHTMAMLRVNGAGFGRHCADEAQLAGDLGFSAAAGARIAIRIGEMGYVPIEQSLQIDLVVGHLATSLPGLERRQRRVGGRVGADRHERVAGQRAELVAIQEILLRQRCGRNAVRRKGRRKLEFPAIV